MTRRLPPLNAVRAFEAAARHQNISKAGEELGVSHGAVSRQIKLLEETLGLRLFDRTNRHVTLTPAGRVCAQAVTTHFDGLATAFARVKEPAAAPVLTVAVNADIGTLWLSERLEDFTQRHPDISLSLRAVRDLTYLPEDADCAIAYGDGLWRDCAFDYLFADSLFVAAAPGVIGGDPALTVPRDLARHHLLHFRDYGEWTRMAQALGVPDLNVYQGPVFNMVALFVGAVTAGQGVALGDFMTVRPQMESGRLRALFGLFLPDWPPFYFLYREADRETPALKAFREWIHEQFAEQRSWAARFQAEHQEAARRR